MYIRYIYIYIYIYIYMYIRYIYIYMYSYMYYSGVITRMCRQKQYLSSWEEGGGGSHNA